MAPLRVAFPLLVVAREALANQPLPTTLPTSTTTINYDSDDYTGTIPVSSGWAAVIANQEQTPSLWTRGVMGGV